MGTRRKSRELALQFLFQEEMAGQGGIVDFDEFCSHFQVYKKAIPYAQKLLAGIREKGAEIDAQISRHAQNWRLERMSHVDRNILRIAVYEANYQDDVPSSVAINEAVEIAKRYSTDDSGPFINGILDALIREESPEKQHAVKEG